MSNMFGMIGNWIGGYSFLIIFVRSFADIGEYS